MAEDEWRLPTLLVAELWNNPSLYGAATMVRGIVEIVPIWQRAQLVLRLLLKLGLQA